MSSANQAVPDQQNPPPYSPPLPLTAAEANFGFPPGYFIIRSLAAGRVLDVENGSIDDGAEVILWPEKETLLVDGKSTALNKWHDIFIGSLVGLRKPEADNQVRDCACCTISQELNSNRYSS